MKKNVLAYFVFLFPLIVFGQSNTIKNTTELTFSEERPISLNFISNECFPASPSLYSIFKQNVFAYFELFQYDTELKQAMFKKTEEYRNYLAKLIEIKANTYKSVYYIQYSDLFLNCDYDVNKKGFDIVLCSFDLNMLASNSSQQKIIYIESIENRIASAFSGSSKNLSKIEENLIRLKTIPSRTLHTNKLSQPSTERIFISMNELNGLEIEENRNEIELFILFSPSGIEQLTSAFLKSQTSKDILVASKARLVICNYKTGKIYFDKIY